MSVPHGRWKTTPFVAGPRRSGLVAPFVIDGAIDRAAFETYIARVLLPEVRLGDTMIMDNLANHNGERIAAMIEAPVGKLLYLLPNSPEFDPIEQAFAKLRALLRKAGERTRDGLWSAIGRVSELFAPKGCANYITAAGYDAN